MATEIVGLNQGPAGNEGFAFTASLPVVTIVSAAITVCWLGRAVCDIIQSRRQQLPGIIPPLQGDEELPTFTTGLDRSDNGHVKKVSTNQTNLKAITFNKTKALVEFQSIPSTGTRSQTRSGNN